MIKMILSDIDGTLLNNKHQVTEKTKKEIQRVVGSGIPFIPVSARMPEAIMPIINDIGVTVPMVCYNGALILDEEGNEIASFPMAADIAYDFCKFIETDHPHITWNVYGGHEWYAQNHDRARVEREERIVQVISTPASLEDIKTMKVVHKILLMGAKEDMDLIEGPLKKKYPSLSIARSSDILLEVMNQGIDKGIAVDILYKHYHLTKEEVVAFGDNYNDLDMLSNVGHAYVMGNAPDEVKKRFTNVTEDHNNDGIALVLKEIL